MVRFTHSQSKVLIMRTTKAPEEGTAYYFPILHIVKLYATYKWYRDEEQHKRYLKRGLVFLNKEAAIANAKAMLGINPYPPHPVDKTNTSS